MKNILKTIALTLSVFALIVSCDEDDFTGDSLQEAATPTLTVELGFANSQTLVEQAATYPFTVNISEAQISSVVVYLSQTGGTATAGEDFNFPASVTIPTGATSASGVIEILSDDIIEDTETVTILIGTSREANVGSVNGQTVTFNIQNLTEGDLAIGMSWAASVLVTDNFGNEMDPTDLADLRLLITDVPYTTILGGADGGSFETTTLDATDPDGEYYIVADFYAADDIPADLNLTLTFDQVGVINGQTHEFASALNTSNSCASVYFILAKITKTGDSYSFEEIAENSPVDATSFVGTATITADDWADYSVGDPIEFEAGANDQEFWIRAYDNPYISNPATAYMIVTLDPATGDATVTSNEPFDYGQGPEGGVSGFGSVNACAGTVQLFITYDLTIFGVYPDYEFSFEL